MQVNQQLDETLANYSKALEHLDYLLSKDMPEDVQKALKSSCMMFLFEGFKLNVMNIIGSVAGIEEEQEK